MSWLYIMDLAHVLVLVGQFLQPGTLLYVIVSAWVYPKVIDVIVPDYGNDTNLIQDAFLRVMSLTEFPVSDVWIVLSYHRFGSG